MSQEKRSDADYQSVTKSPQSRQHIAESVVLRLRGNSDEDALDYEYQVTEAVRVDVGALEYKVPRGAVGVSAVALRPIVKAAKDFFLLVMTSFVRNPESWMRLSDFIILKY